MSTTTSKVRHSTIVFDEVLGKPQQLFNSYLNLLAALYYFGAFVHALDIFSLRLDFSTLTTTWKIWIIYLAAFEFLASIGLCFKQTWGVSLFLFIAFSQMVAYSGMFVGTFGEQNFMLGFHVVTVTIFFWLKSKANSSTQ